VTCEVGLSRSVRAFHIMPGLPGPEGELHDHDYRIEIVVDREQLDGRGMVCDLDVLEAALTELTTASIGAPVARRQAAALACRVPLALSGRSRSPLKRCSGESRVSPCRSRTVVVGSAVGLSQPRVIWLPPRW
jgi:hypothetical protein